MVASYERIASQVGKDIFMGKISLELRKKGLTKEIKPDNTPVSNGDIEVNKILTNEIMFGCTGTIIIFAYIEFVNI